MADLGEDARFDEPRIRLLKLRDLFGVRVDRDRDEHEIATLERELMEPEQRGLLLPATFAPRRPKRRDRHATVSERREVRRLAARVHDRDMRQIRSRRSARGGRAREDESGQKRMAVEHVKMFAERSFVRKYRS